MFYKVLLLECLMCMGLVSLKVYQEMPPTTLAVGETTLEIKTDLPTSPAAVPPLPTVDLAPVAAGGLTFPVAGHGVTNVISVFGDKRGKTRLHQGIDVKAPAGTPVVAVTDGFVERINEGGSGGKQIYLRDGQGRLFYYAHLDGWAVEEFDAVSAGQVIGTVGDTGNAKGTTPHLHFEVMLGKKKKAVDPLRYWVAP